MSLCTKVMQEGRTRFVVGHLCSREGQRMLCFLRTRRRGLFSNEIYSRAYLCAVLPFLSCHPYPFLGPFRPFPVVQSRDRGQRTRKASDVLACILFCSSDAYEEPGYLGWAEKQRAILPRVWEELSRVKAQLLPPRWVELSQAKAPALHAKCLELLHYAQE